MTEEEKRKFEIAPYYERQGLAAEGAADEWLATTQKKVNEKMKTLDPRVRGLMAPSLSAFVGGHYENLKRFEAREVRRGKIDKLNLDLENRASAISRNICAQADAERRSDEKNLADIEKEYAEVTRPLDELVRDGLMGEDEADRVRQGAERRRTDLLAALQQSKDERTAAHIGQMLAEIEGSAPLVDSAVEAGLFDQTSGIVRKRKAARVAVLDTIMGLADSGHFDLAEAFVENVAGSAREVVGKDGRKSHEHVPSAIGRELNLTRVDTEDIRRHINTRRREFDLQIVDQAANVGIAAVAQIRDKDGNYQPGRLATVEQSIETLQRIGSTLPQGSRAATEAAAEASRINGEADREVSRMIENSLLSGENLMMDDGKTLVYDQNTEKRFIRLYPAVKSKVDEMRRKDRSRVMSDNARDLHMSEVMLDYAIQDGTLSEDQIAFRKRDIYDRARAMTEGQLLSPEDWTSFRKRWTARNAADESAAAVEFDRAFGLTLRDFADANGDISTEISDAGYKKAVKSGQKAVFPGTDKKVSLGEYLKMRASFLERLRALPANADRRQETSKLLEEFKGGWYSRQAEANIDALARTMNDIHLGIEAEVEAERLKAAAEEEKRNMPVVDMRHPANAEPQPDPLEFYRRANPLDPTILFR